MSITGKRTSYMSKEKRKKIVFMAALLLGVPLVFGGIKKPKQNPNFNSQEVVMHDDLYDSIFEIIESEELKQNSSENIITIIDSYLKNRNEENQKVIYNVNSEYCITDEIRLVSYLTSEEKSASLYMYRDLSSADISNGNEIYRSITTPEISLVSSIDKHETSYKLQRDDLLPDERNQKFSEFKIIENDIVVGPKTFHYQNVLKEEEALNKHNNGEFKHICRLDYKENGNPNIRIVEYYKTVNNTEYFKSITSPELYVSSVKDEQGHFNGYEIVVDGKIIESTNVMLVTFIGIPNDLSSEEAEAMEKRYMETYNTWHVSTVESYNRFTFWNIKEVTFQIDNNIITRLMYCTTNGENNFYNPITNQDGIIIETLDANRNTQNFYYAQDLFENKSSINVISIEDYTGNDMTFEEAVAYEAKKNAKKRVRELDEI